MSTLQFVFTTRDCTVIKKSSTKFYKTGTCVSKHRSYMAAVKQSDMIDKSCGNGATLLIEASKDDYEVSKIYASKIETLLTAMQDERYASLLNKIIDAREAGITIADHIKEEIAETGLSFDEFESKHTKQAQALRDERDQLNLERAERLARIEAIDNGLETSDSEYCFSFPAVQGVQASSSFYLASIPFKHLIRIFQFDVDVVPPEFRAQRQLNPVRAKKFGQYLLDNPDSFVIPALTATVSAEMTFQALNQPGTGNQLGLLKLPFDAIFNIIDGQHRRAGLEWALTHASDSITQHKLASQSVSVSIFFDKGLRSSQQWFSDINGSTVKPSSSLSALYNQRDGFNVFIQEILNNLSQIKSMVDMENASVGSKSLKLWSLVGFSKFITLLTGINSRNIEQKVNDGNRREWITMISKFIDGLSAIPSWDALLKREISGYEARSELIIPHAVFLEALGIMGHLLIQSWENKLTEWDKLKKLTHVDINKQAACWENRCLVLGRLQKTSDGAKSTAALLCRIINIELSDALKEVDARFDLTNVA
jgi:DNA sulfur modification protein DndB